MNKGVIVVVAALAIGCSDRSSKYFGSTTRRSAEGTIVINNASEPEHIDPGKCHDATGVVIASQLFEGLTAYDPRDGHPIQGVATRWDVSRDGRRYRFHLRDDARWSDGKPVVAEDFAYAWRRVLKPKTGARGAPNLYPLVNAELYNRGLLLALAEDTDLLAEPGGAKSGRLGKGTAVKIIEKKTLGKEPWALIERHDDLPSFGAPRAKPEGPPIKGFVRVRALVEDDTLVGVRATDARTLDVELREATPYFTDLTSYVVLAPVRRDVVERFEREGEEELWVRPGSIVSNGAYVMDSWRFQYAITMRENPHYWARDKLKIKRIEWLEVSEYRAAMNLYKTAEMDYLGDNTAPPAEYLPIVEKKADFWRTKYLSVYFYELNTKKPPLDKLGVRRALSLAIDRRELIDRVVRGGQDPATHMVPDYTGLGYEEQVARERREGRDRFADPPNGFDPERARALMKDAGYPIVEESGVRRAEGFPPIELLYNTAETHRTIAVAVQAMWKRHLGVSITLRNEEWKVMLANYNGRKFDIVRVGMIGEYNHPHTFLDMFRSTSLSNNTGWSDPKFDAALRAAAMEQDRQKSMELYRDAEQIAVSATVRIPIYFYTRQHLVKPWVKGFWGTRRNPHIVQFLWIDPAWESRPEGTNEPAYPPPEAPPPGVLP